MSKFSVRSKIAAVGIATVTLAAPAAALAATSSVDRQIPMRGSAAYPKANGSAQYQSQPGQRDLQVEVLGVRSLAGRTVVFSAGGTRLGSAKVSVNGQADITRNSEQGNRVPSMHHNSTVTVRTADGKLVTYGRF